jgi:hypothetical protein
MLLTFDMRAVYKLRIVTNVLCDAHARLGPKCFARRIRVKP